MTRGIKKQQPATYTRDQVIALLKKQIAVCAAAAEGNCTDYTAKRKIREVKPVEF